MSGKHRIFVSSVQKELAAERRAVRDFIEGDALLCRFFSVFLFEDLPASGRRADHAYLTEVDLSDIYLGLFGNDYGFQDSAGISPTEHEFNRATIAGKERLIFVKGSDDRARRPEMRNLIRKASDQVTRRRFTGVTGLTAMVYSSLVDFLASAGDLRTKPFDAAACPGARISDLSRRKVTEFLVRAWSERSYPLGPKTPLRTALAHLNLLDGGRPTHAAILLFGKAPQRFLISSEVKCLSFHGTEVQKPIPSYQIYKGTIFELVNQALDFVMTKIDRAVGTRSEGPQAPVTYELPRDAVAEAIVNAVAHRDYTANASVQVMLFSDRLEIWNPGRLPSTLTFEALRKPHASIPHNPLIAEPLFLTRYIEKAGTGILDMISLCKKAGLHAPAFRQAGGQFVQTIRRPKPERQTSGQVAVKTRPESQPESQPESLDNRTLLILRKDSSNKAAISERLGQKEVSGQLNTVIRKLLKDGFIAYTIPAKPNSRLQKYRLTGKGHRAIEKAK